MGVINVEQIYDGENLSQDRKVTEHVLAWSVETDDPTDGLEVVYNASAGGVSVPQMNAIELSTGLRVVHKNVRRDADNPNFWTVEVSLSSAADDQPSSGKGKEKLTVDIRITSELYDEPIYMDSAGKAICNAAGQPFSNQPTKTYYDDKVNITFKTAVPDLAAIESCKGNTNDATVVLTVRGLRRTFAAGTLKLVDAPIGTLVAEGVYLFDCAYVLAYRKDGWKRKILNMGRQQLGSDGKLAPIRISHTQDATEDVPLDKNGHAILDGAVDVAKNITDPTLAAGKRCYIEFDLSPRVSFTQLLTGIR